MNKQVAFLNQLLENFFTLGGEDFDKMQASRNLSALSQTQDFLDISMTLLSAYQLSENKMLLLSCMIKDKFRYDFELIDSQKLKSYYQLLCEFASKYGTKCKPFFNNISQSLALIYLNQIACNDLPLTEFLAIFQTEDQKQFALFNYYFKILEQCAEHVNNSRVVLDEEYRKIAKEKIKNQQLQVIQILNEAVKTVWYNPLVSKMVSKIRIINCFTSWIDLNYDPQIFNNLHDTSLLNEIVICLRTEPNQAESAVECLKALIQRIQSPQKNSQLFQYLGSACYELVPYIDARIAQGQLEKVEELMSLVIFFSQKFSVFLVQTYSEHTRDFLMSLIRYMNTNLPKIVDLLIQFWQDLVQLFVSAKHEKTLSMELKMDLPIALLHVLIEKCTYPPAILRQLETVFQHKIGCYFDLGEQIFNNRFSAESCFDGLAQLLGVNYYIDYIRQNISELDYKQPMFFSTLEAYLYALIPALKKLQDITASVRVIIQTYEHLFKNMQPILLGVKRTFLKVFKAILGIKIKDHNLTQKMYYFTIECLSDTMLVDTAAKAFQKACQYNPHYLYNIIVQISGIVKNHVYEEQIVRGYITLASFNKKNASFVISDCLEFLLSHARHDFLDGLRSKQCVDTLTCAIKEIKDCSFEGKKELLKDFVKQAWDFILTTLKSPLSSSQDQDLKIERIVKLIKTIMRTLKSDFIPYLSQLFTTVNEYFQKYPICSYIYLLQIAVTVFSALQNEQIQTFLKEVYQNFTQSAFAHLQNQQNIEDYSFLLDDFLGMNARLLIYNTKIIVSSSHFVNLITFITEVCLQTTTNRAVKATYSFLQTLFMIYWNNDFIQAYNKEQREEEKDNSISIQPIVEDINLYGYLNQHLKEELTVMIKRMLENLASIPADSTKNQILDTLLSQIKAFTDVNPQIWKQILSQISPNILLQTEKEHIILLMESIRQQLQIFEKVRVWVKQLNNFLNLIYRRMVMADKRRKINIKD